MNNLFFTLFAKSCDHTFFGLVPWYHYLKLNNKCEIQGFTLFPDGAGGASSIPLILLAIIDDMLRIAGIVAVIFVIVGALSYITSQGNPDDTSKAQGTIVNALIGLAIAIVSVAFVSFLGSRLGG